MAKNRLNAQVTRSRGTRLMMSCLLLSTIGCIAKPMLRYEGHSAITWADPVMVDAVVTVRNHGSKTAKIPRPFCALRILAFEAVERTSQVWQSAPQGCIAFPMKYPPILIGPGDFYDFRVRVSIPRSQVKGLSPLFLSMEVPSSQAPIPVGQVSPWVSPPNTR